MGDAPSQDSNNDGSQEETIERFVGLLAKNIHHNFVEEILLADLEEFFSPRPAKLFTCTVEQDALQRKVDSLSRRFDRLGPLLILPQDADPISGKVKIDAYHTSLANEWFSYFYKCRRSICYTHSYYITYGMIAERPALWPDMPDDARAQAIRLFETRFLG